MPHKAQVSRALAFLQQNDLASAQSLCAEIIADDPQHGLALFILGIVQARQGDLSQAESTLRQATAIAPDLTEGWLNLGQVHELQGRFADAEAALMRALMLKPASLVIRESLGRVYSRAGRYDDAIRQYRQVVDSQPDRLPALLGLITSLHMAGLVTEAGQICMQALSIAPEDVRLRVSMGQIFRDMVQPEEALLQYRKALQLDPGHVPARYGEAETLKLMGRPDQALALLQPLLHRLDDDPDLLILYARICARLKLDEPMIERLERALGNPALDDQTRERIHFLLGELLDKQARYDDAFAHFQAGNGSVWRRMDKDRDLAAIDAIIACFDALDGALQPNPQTPAITPIFIVGMPRSGTSLVEQILASHPQVTGAGELNSIGVIATESGYGSTAFHPDTTALQSMTRRYIDIVTLRAGGRRCVTDKMPRNFLFLGLIALMFPASRIIHTRRDPLDTCLSCYFQKFSGAHAYSYDLETLGRYYRQYEKLMAFWRRQGIAFLDVQYENLVDDLEGVSRRMTAYCGLDWDAACLDFHQSGRVIATASYHQVASPIYRTSIGRWRNYEKFLAPLQEGLASPR